MGVILSLLQNRFCASSFHSIGIHVHLDVYMFVFVSIIRIPQAKTEKTNSEFYETQFNLAKRLAHSQRALKISWYTYTQHTVPQYARARVPTSNSFIYWFPCELRILRGFSVFILYVLMIIPFDSRLSNDGFSCWQINSTWSKTIRR